MARWRLIGPWPVGAWLIPSGTVLDSADMRWSGMALPTLPPINARALDQEAYDILARVYSGQLGQLQYVEGVVPRTTPV